MRVLKRFFWAFLIIAAFIYGFVFGSEQIAIADVQTFVEDAWRSVQDPVAMNIHMQEIMEHSLTVDVQAWLQEIFEKAYSLICFFSDGVV